jgi:hypothetical protein
LRPIADASEAGWWRVHRPARAVDAVDRGIQIRDDECWLACAARELDQRAERRIACGEPAERLIALVQREAARLIVVAQAGSSSTSTVNGPLARASVPRAPASSARTANVAWLDATTRDEPTRPVARRDSDHPAVDEM